MTLNDEDLEIITGCNAAHPQQRGGQHVARSCSSVMIIHKPTGIGVRSDSERSQHGNKTAALESLRRVLNLVTGSLDYQVPVTLIVPADAFADLEERINNPRPPNDALLVLFHADTCRCETCKVHA